LTTDTYYDYGVSKPLSDEHPKSIAA